MRRLPDHGALHCSGRPGRRAAEKLEVDARAVVAVRERAIDLAATDGVGFTRHTKGAEASPGPLGSAELVEVDLDGEDAVDAADEGAAILPMGVQALALRLETP